MQPRSQSLSICICLLRGFLPSSPIQLNFEEFMTRKVGTHQININDEVILVLFAFFPFFPFPLSRTALTRRRSLPASGCATAASRHMRMEGRTLLVLKRIERGRERKTCRASECGQSPICMRCEGGRVRGPRKEEHLKALLDGRGRILVLKRIGARSSHILNLLGKGGKKKLSLTFRDSLHWFLLS